MQTRCHLVGIPGTKLSEDTQDDAIDCLCGTASDANTVGFQTGGILPKRTSVGGKAALQCLERQKRPPM